MSPSTILYTVPDGFQSSVLLRTELLTALREDDRNRWVFVTPMAGSADFSEQLSGPNSEVVAWPADDRPALLRGVLSLEKRAWQHRHSMHRGTATSGWIGRVLSGHQPASRAAADCVARLPGVLTATRALAQSCGPKKPWEAILDRYQPRAIVLGSAAVKWPEVPLAKVARQRKIPVYGVVPSWDNLTTKGMHVGLCDRVSVWCPMMHSEARRLCGFLPEQIDVTGPPLFDHHMRPPAAEARQKFFAAHGLDPARRLIVYTSITPHVCPFSCQYAELLAGMIDGGLLGAPCQLLARMHPQDDFPSFEALARRPNVHVQWPARYRTRASGYEAIYGFDPSSDDMRRLTETLHFADVVVNIASTITLEACGLNRPVVNIAFNLPGWQHRFIDIASYYALEHYSPVTRSGAATVAHSSADLHSAVCAALAAPERQAQQRRELYRLYDPYADGRSARRLAASILRFVGTEQGNAAADRPAGIHQAAA